MKRILGVEDKNRVRTHVMIEKELIDLVRERHMRLSDIVNVLLEKELSGKKPL